MPQIRVKNLTKIFRVPAQAPGLGGAVKEWRDLPFAFIGYYPTVLLLDKMAPPPLPGYLSPLAGLAVTAAAALVRRRCLVSYQGTGS